MAPFQVMVSRIWHTFTRSHRDADLDVEIIAHLEELVDAHVERGLSPSAARIAARKQFGPVGAHMEATRAQQGFPELESVLQDLRYGARLLARSPAFSLAAAVCLGTAIGAAALIGALSYRTLLRPLPFRASERMIRISNLNTAATGSATAELGSRASQLSDWNENAMSLEQVEGWNNLFAYATFNVTGLGVPERIAGIQVSAGLLHMLDVKPSLGRVFEPADGAPGAQPNVVLGSGYWQRRFGGMPDIVGQTLTINQQLYRVIGVVPSNNAFLGTLLPGSDIDVYVPLILDDRSEQLGFYLAVVGTLKPGVTIEQARADLESRGAVLAEARPFMKPFRPQLQPLRDWAIRRVRAPLTLLSAGAVCILLAGFASVASLLLARATTRRRELATRRALGATRRRLVRQVLTETTLIAVLAGTLAAGLSQVSRVLLNRVAALAVPGAGSPELTAVSLAAVALLTVVSFALLATFPAASAARLKLSELFVARGAASTDRRRQVFQRALVSAQVALTIALLIGAGMLTRSFANLTSVDMGFEPQGVVSARVDPGSRLPRGPRLSAFLSDIHTAASLLPDVRSAALVYPVPLDRPPLSWEVAIPGTLQNEHVKATASTRVVSPDYFRTMGIRLVRGRDFAPSDAAEGPRVVVINETLARQIATLHDPLGSTLIVGGTPTSVVAIVRDVRHRALDQPADAEVYLSYRQWPGFTAFDVVVRTNAPIGRVAPAISAAVRSVDPNQPVGSIVSLQTLVERSMLSRRVVTTILVAFAAAALIVALAGLYGLLSYRVAMRTAEFGVRLALGARAVNIRTMVLREALGMIAFGAIAAIPLTWWMSSIVGQLLFGVERWDALTIATTTVIVCLTAVAAAYLPARKASRLAPSLALRWE